MSIQLFISCCFFHSNICRTRHKNDDGHVVSCVNRILWKLKMKRWNQVTELISLSLLLFWYSFICSGTCIFTSCYRHWWQPTMTRSAIFPLYIKFSWIFIKRKTKGKIIIVIVVIVVIIFMVRVTLTIL